MKKVVLIVVVLFSMNAKAIDWQLNVSLLSKHYMDPPAGVDSYNEKNLGIGAQIWIRDQGFVEFGGVDNSFDRFSKYFAVGLKLYESDGGHQFGFQYAGADGYAGVNPDKPSDGRQFYGPYYQSAGKHGLKIFHAFKLTTVQYFVGF